ncbi:MAG: large-conductance mechanosensitive channel protein MscL [Bacteroidales bacterium]|nr:large-conductance mechanosensitive channel protein MscL [Bacteroidales bacterium]MBN2761452.1 large-conductance mechanosensitive channel protein MscL [Bacteroidales bacterium]
MKLVQEFKQFAVKGNMMDMAIGIIIGTAFGKIIASLVSDVIMPPIGLLLGGIDFTDMKAVLKQETVDELGEVIPAVTLNYGTFIQTAVDFLIIAIVVFMMIKAMNSLKKKEEEAPAAPPAPTKDQELLTEIRDLLKK